MTILSHLIGGLGNQLFQYAAAFALARREGAQLRIDNCVYDYALDLTHYYHLKHFTHGNRLVATSRAARFAYKLSSAERQGLRPIASLTRFALGVTDVHEAKPYHYHPIQLPAPAPARLRLRGYWQSPHYFDDVQDALRQSLTFADPLSDTARQIDARIQSSYNPVSLHVRRGDYLRVRPEAVLPIAYYQNAINHLAQSIPDPTYFVFSDDIAWARTHLPLPGQPIFVTANAPLPAHEDLRLMSRCRYHIIANSSFSWWGAWLNPRPDKRVIAPKFWLGTPDSHYPDLYPTEWTILDNTLKMS